MDKLMMIILFHTIYSDILWYLNLDLIRNELIHFHTEMTKNKMHMKNYIWMGESRDKLYPVQLIYCPTRIPMQRNISYY